MTEAQPAAFRPENPRLPADLGLPALGLLCQAQALFVTLYATLVAFFTLITGTLGGARVAVVGVLALGAIRAGVHHAAGRALTERSPLIFTAVRRYLVVSAGTTVATLAILVAVAGELPLTVYVAAALAAAYWPVTLALLVLRRDVRATFEAADTFDLSLVPGDRSVEGAGVLMTVLASVGLGVGLILLSFLVQLPLEGIEAILLVVLTVLLIVRAAVHLHAGITALRGVTAATFDGLTARYLGLGLATAGAATLLLLIASHGRGLLLVAVAIMLTAGLLLTWPLVVRRFARQVLLDDHGDDDEAPFGPAPDRGLTAFGFLLIAIGAPQLTQILIQLILPFDLTGLLSGGAGGDPAEAGFNPMLLLSLAVTVITLWAGVEAVRMSARRTLAIGVYGVTTVLAAAIVWVDNGTALDLPSDFSAAPTLVVSAVLQIAVPVTGLLLARRRLPLPPERTPPRGVAAFD